MLKNRLLFCVFCIFPYLICAQVESDSLKKTLIIGASFTYIPDFRTDPMLFEEEYVVHESTLNLNIGYQLHKNFRLGVTGMQIKTNSEYSEKETQYMIGGSFKYLFDVGSKEAAFIETGFYQGNYCTCTPSNPATLYDVPYKRANLSYCGLGAGAEFRLSRHWQLDLGFYNYLILDEVSEKYNFTQYVIGIDFIL